MNTVIPPGQQELAKLNSSGQAESAMNNGGMKQSYEENNPTGGPGPMGETATTMAAPPSPGPKKTIAFWSIIIALAFAGLLTALEATIVSTALPTIINDLGGGDLYIWTVNIYFLTT